MLDSNETPTESHVEPIDGTSESSSEISTDALDDEAVAAQSGRPSKTLVAAILILTVTIGIALYAGFTLWSLSDHQASPQESTTSEQTDDR
jgi:flagellar basal body-associated protein FliL